MVSNPDSHKNHLPLLLRNLKKAFDQNIQGPIIQKERQYQATTKSNFLFDVVNFLSIRGVDKLAAINAWNDKDEIKLAYHFIARIGPEMLDSKITIITFIPNKEKNIHSIKRLYKNARIFEEEIISHFEINFIEKK